MRSPAALVASLACLVSAMALAGLLVHDGEASTETLAEATEGEALRVRGELEPWDTPDRWDEIHGALSGVTYRLQVEGVEDIILLTGMEAGWEAQTVVADAVVVLHVTHPERALDVIVLAVEEVKEPAIFR